jgi:peroxiredoxin
MSVSPYPENAAPDFTLTQPPGQPLTLSDFRGKPTIINFWATWCPPCRRELPALEAAYQMYQDQIGFVAVDVKEDAATVAAFVEELGLTFPVAIDPDGRVSDVAYEVRGLPTTLFVDAQGVVVARHVGPLDEATIESYLTPLLALPAVTAGPPAPAVEGGQVTVSAASEEDAPVEQSDTSPLEADLLLAPDFTSTTADGSTLSLEDYRDKKNVVLVFYRGHT